MQNNVNRLISGRTNQRNYSPLHVSTDFGGVLTETTSAIHPAKFCLGKAGEQILKFLKCES